MSELKPCPFCGSEARIMVRSVLEDYVDDHYRELYAYCIKCGAIAGRQKYVHSDDVCGMKNVTIESWNKRHEQPTED